MKINPFYLLITYFGCQSSPNLEAITVTGIGDVVFDIQHPLQSKYAFDSKSSGFIVDESNDSTYQYVYNIESDEVICAIAEQENGEVWRISTNSDNFETGYQAQVGKTLRELQKCNMLFELLDGDGGAYFLYERKTHTLLGFDDFLELEGVNTCKPIKIRDILKANPINEERRINDIEVQKFELPPLGCG